MDTCPDAYLKERKKGLCYLQGENTLNYMRDMKVAQRFAALNRRVILRTPHHLSLAPIIAKTDLVATVPLATATLFADVGFVEIEALPFAPPRFDVQQYWHRRSQNDPRVRWLQRQIESLFNDGTDSWRSEEQRLYPRLQGGGRRAD